MPMTLCHTVLIVNTQHEETTMKKAKFESRDFGMCVVLTQPNGIVREFHIPHNISDNGYGYIREGSNIGPQVCSGLVHSGNTLSASPETLLSVIQREWRKYRKSESYELESAGY